MSDADPIPLQGNTGNRSAPTLVDTAGAPLRTGTNDPPTDQVLDFVQKQPVAAVLLAFMAGYVLGRLA